MVTAIALIVIYRVIAVFLYMYICIINAEFRGSFVTCNKNTIV